MASYKALVSKTAKDLGKKEDQFVAQFDKILSDMQSCLKPVSIYDEKNSDLDSSQGREAAKHEKLLTDFLAKAMPFMCLGSMRAMEQFNKNEMKEEIKAEIKNEIIQEVKVDMARTKLEINNKVNSEIADTKSDLNNQQML